MYGLCPVFPGNMVLIAGCTGSKKSTYLHHIVNQNIIAGHRVAYCCIKDKPFDVGIEIIGENVHVNAEYIKRGIMTEEDWGKLTSSPSSLDGENLTLFDIVQLLYKPDLFYNTEEEKERLEV